MMRRLINWTGYLPKPDSLISRVRSVTSVVTVLNQTSQGSAGSSVAGGGVAWTNPGNALTANNQFATAVLNSGTPLSNYLRVSGFTFTVTGTIVGIIIALLRRNPGHPASGLIANASTTLSLNGLVVAEKVPGSLYPATNTTELLGGESDLWGYAWIPEEINSPLLSIETQAEYLAGDADCTASVDRMAMTVYYIP